MPRLRRRPAVEELFILNAVLALTWAAVWIAWRSPLLLEFFYFPPLLALTHLVTLGFLSSLMMGVLYRLAPMLLGVEARSRAVARFQLVLFLIGIWGMIAHFWLGEWKGMSWSAFLVFGSALLQLLNFRGLFRAKGKATWSRRFVAASLLHFVLAASLGVLLSVVKAYDWRPSFLAGQYLDNVFAHAHLAGVGWVTGMIFGFELQLVPTTAGSPRWLPLRFALFQIGSLGLAWAFLTELDVAFFALALALACLWQAWGRAPARLWLSRSFVFFDAVVRAVGYRPEILRKRWLTAREVRDLFRALARVIAHEVIHALLPASEHIEKGLTRMVLDRESLLDPGVEIELSVARAFRAALHRWRMSLNPRQTAGS